MSKTNQLIIIFSLLILNIYLLYLVLDLKKDNKFLLEEVLSSNSIAENISLKDRAPLSNNSLFLLKVFFSGDCPSCINKEVQQTNWLFERFPGKITSLYVTDSDEGINSNFEVGFNYEIISHEDFNQLFSKSVSFSGTTSLLVMDSVIIDYYTVNISNIGLSDRYNKRFEYLLENL